MQNREQAKDRSTYHKSEQWARTLFGGGGVPGVLPRVLKMSGLSGL